MNASPRFAPRALAPLRLPVFRMLWGVWLGANVALSMHDVAAGWMMAELTHSAVWVALVSAAATLPMFLLGLPSGALADIVDRRRYFAATQLWAAGVATALAAVALADGLNPPLLLALTFLNGITMAMRWPLFSAIVPSLVPREQLPQALALNGVAMNLPRIVGPMIAGALLGAAGAGFVFALNALISASAFVTILRWRPEHRERALPGERFLGAIRVGVQHVASSPPLRRTLLHIALFMLQVASLAALLPLVAKGMPGEGAGRYAALLASSGIGAIAVALVFPHVRDRLGRNAILRVGRLVHVAASVSVVLAPGLVWALPGMALCGAAILMTANTLSVSAQQALPDWVRARGIAVYQMALMGSSAAGAALWGQVAQGVGVRNAVLLAATFGVACALAGRRVALLPAAMEEHLPAPVVAPPEVAIAIDDDEGPVMVTVEYQIDPAQREAFDAVMRETRRARLRQGVLSWDLLRDTSVPGRYIEYFVDESWLEHQRRLARFTAGDAGLRERRLALHRGSEPPRVRRYVGSSPLP